MQLGPESDAIGWRGLASDRAKPGNVVMPHSAVDAPGLNKADLQAPIGLSKADEHCSGTIFA